MDGGRPLWEESVLAHDRSLRRPVSTISGMRMGTYLKVIARRQGGSLLDQSTGSYERSVGEAEPIHEDRNMLRRKRRHVHMRRNQAHWDHGICVSSCAVAARQHGKVVLVTQSYTHLDAIARRRGGLLWSTEAVCSPERHAHPKG
jgi:hypothetical protein